MKKISLFSFFVLSCLIPAAQILAGNDYYKYTQFEHSATPQKIQEGRELYMRNCVRCHGADGMLTPRRDVKPIAYFHPYKVFDELIDYKTDDDFFDFKEKAMRDVTSRLSFQQLESIAHYVGTLNPANLSAPYPNHTMSTPYPNNAPSPYSNTAPVPNPNNTQTPQ